MKTLFVIIMLLAAWVLPAHAEEETGATKDILAPVLF